jgi:hypothetical protein
VTNAYSDEGSASTAVCVELVIHRRLPLAGEFSTTRRAFSDEIVTATVLSEHFEVFTPLYQTIFIFEGTLLALIMQRLHAIVI